ncbi:MAG: DUF3551 domain-containing protein [Pseudomonadota bacterium]|jgi:hypothetical protein
MSQKQICHIEATSAQRWLVRVRTIALPLVVAIAWGVAFLVSAARAQDYGWCIAYDSEIQCDYTTRQQCMAAGSGIGATCMQNPRLSVESPSRAAYAKYK